MPSTSQRLIIDTEANNLVGSFGPITGVTAPVFVLGDTAPIELYLRRSAGIGGGAAIVPFPAGATIRVAIGQINAQPTSGAWSVDFDGDEATGLAFNISAADLQDELNGLASITSAGGVVVDKVGGQFRVAFNTVGARPSFVGGSNTLVPASTLQVQTLQEGDASTKEVVMLNLAVNPVALTTTFTDTPDIVTAYSSTGYTITGTVRAGGYRLQVSFEQDGVASTVWTDSILYGANTTQISQAIFQACVNANWGNIANNQTVNAWGVLTTELEGGEWRVDFTAPEFSTPVPAVLPTIVGIDGSQLLKLEGKVGTLGVNTVEAVAFLGTDESARAILEVEVEDAGGVQTVLQTTCTIQGQVIYQGAFESLPLETPITETVANARFLRRDADQTLDSTTKDQLWENLTGVTTPTGVDLVGALTNAAAPSASNPLVTQSEVQTFDQSLNSGDAVTFASVNATDGTNATQIGPEGVTINDADVLTSTSLDLNDGTTGFSITVGGGFSTITFGDSTAQTTAFIPADYLSKAGNLSGIADTSIARTNLGLGTIATAAAADYLSKAGNLSGLADTSIARTNLGLGSMAVETAANYLTVSTAASTYALLTSFDQGVKTTDDVTFNTVTLTAHLAFNTTNTLEDASYAAGANISAPATHIDVADYPDEVRVVVNGVTYAMPARIV